MRSDIAEALFGKTLLESLRLVNPTSFQIFMSKNIETKNVYPTFNKVQPLKLLQLEIRIGDITADDNINEELEIQDVIILCFQPRVC